MSSELTTAFIEGLGSPNPTDANGISFSSSINAMLWENISKAIGAGYFNDSFLYLFGRRLQELEDCLKHWDFLLDKDTKYTILGFNKHGMILIAAELDRLGVGAEISVLDPWTASRWTNPNIKFLNMLGNWLPTGKIPYFNSSKVYTAWSIASPEPLDFLEILAIKIPLTLDGTLEVSNFQIENIVEYYKSTGEIYRRNKK